MVDGKCGGTWRVTADALRVSRCNCRRRRFLRGKTNGADVLEGGAKVLW